jgi:hypothetical protein
VHLIGNYHFGKEACNAIRKNKWRCKPTAPDLYL